MRETKASTSACLLLAYVIGEVTTVDFGLWSESLPYYHIADSSSSLSNNGSSASESSSGGGIKPLRISLKWRRISENPEEIIGVASSSSSNNNANASSSSNHDIEGEGLMVEHEEAFDEDEFTRRVLGDDGMSSGSEDHAEFSTSPVVLHKPGRRLLEDDDDEDDDDDDDDGDVVSSSDEDDDDVVDLIKESMPPSELHSLHLSDDDLEDAAADDDIDSDDESDLPSVLPLRIVKSPVAPGSPSDSAAAAGAGGGGGGGGTDGYADGEEVNIITLDKIDEQLTDPTIVASND
ncbi:hypothetical protein AA313_de0201510 [Arthrobotrys entomopaga]|nr:hypothetical protein AA313_de0201510 [Arthrobotrys entomopaga]